MGNMQEQNIQCKLLLGFPCIKALVHIVQHVGDNFELVLGCKPVTNSNFLLGNSKWFYWDFSCIPKPENDKGVEGEDEGEGNSKTKQEWVEGEQSLRQIRYVREASFKGTVSRDEYFFSKV